jgi:hypothetical protein
VASENPSPDTNGVMQRIQFTNLLCHTYFMN